ncbi:MarR family winged helix-turn-helix transcriptional regulator [Carnimonas bestiolae]|uniref:MarR family winged helix-turn-helix transcriptional regulator n=1 Tax=Carnimonas bestiolae TaxID=3402172 RepID=UPI003EDB8DC9
MVTSSDPLRLDQQACFPLYAASNLIQQLYHPLLKPLGLTYSQYLVMLVLWELSDHQTDISISDIKKRLKLDIGTLSPLLKRMEKAGHLQRQRSDKDERRVIITLTDHAKALREQARDIPACLFNQVGISLEELRTLREHVIHLVEKLEQANAQRR